MTINDRTGKKLYEVTVQSTSNKRATSQVMPAMVASAFADFPGQSGVNFPHFGFNEGVPGDPHQRIAAVRFNVFIHEVRTLHLADNRGAGFADKQLAGEQAQKLVAKQEASVFIHHPKAVGVAVEADAQIRAFF